MQEVLLLAAAAALITLGGSLVGAATAAAGIFGLVGGSALVAPLLVGAFKLSTHVLA